MILGGIELRELQDSPFPAPTSPNPGLEAAIDCFSLFRCGPALLAWVLWVDPSRDTAAHMLGYMYLLNTLASLLGAFEGGVPLPLEEEEEE